MQGAFASGGNPGTLGQPGDNLDVLVCCRACGAVFVMSKVIAPQDAIPEMTPDSTVAGSSCTSCLQTGGYRVIADIRFRGVAT